MGRASKSAVQKRLNIPGSVLAKLSDEIFPDASGYKHQNIALCKNIDSVYIDQNAFSRHLGSTKHNGNLVGLTDPEVTPELADIHIAQDHKVIAKKQAIEFDVDVVVKEIGKTPSKVTISPMRNEHGDCTGVLILGRPILDITNLSFGQLLNYLNKGYASLLLQNDFYEVSLGDFTPTKVSRREMEIMLYWLIGFTAKETALRIDTSHRSVENTIFNLKIKLDVISRSDLIARLFPLLM